MTEEQPSGPPPGADMPLTLTLLTPDDLAAVAGAVAEIVAASHPAPVAIEVGWSPGATGDDWYVSVPSLASYDPTVLARDLLLPIARAARPRALKWEYLAPIDQLTAADILAIGMAGTMPSASAYEKRWVENRTVAMGHAAHAPDLAALNDAWGTLEGCYRALGLEPPRRGAT